ncbi:MAG: carboxypeptidase-like regulatory domain-containing protein [Flavobacteriaceae bacterium]|nr:carboxypeptidase-like regulatory domain-containing protein [Flavobacteriaceae bacterium]
MNSNKAGFLFIILLWAGCFWGWTQESKPLVEVLTQLEASYSCTFNYAEQTIQDISVEAPNPNLSLAESVDFLANETGLIFEILENNFISIQKNTGLVLCGYILDKDTFEPLESATVQAEGASVVTDQKGYFSIKVRHSGVTVKIRYLGYRSLQRSYYNFKTSVCDAIYLVPEAEELTQVILSNYLVKGIDKLNTGEFQLNTDRFGLLPGLIEPDVLQAVQSFPGIQSINETVSNLNIRGGTHDQNLILWDDIKMYKTGHFFGLISAFNPQITQKVSLRKNGTPSEYSDGVSGTISMQTEEDVNGQLNGNIGVNLIDASGFVDVPLGEKSSIQVAGRKSISDVWKTPTYEEYFKRISQDTEVSQNSESVANTDQTFDFYDVSFRWLYEISETDRLRLNFILMDNALTFDENAVVSGVQTSRQSSVSQNNLAAGLFYEREWSDRFATIFQIYNSDYKLRAINANLLLTQRFLQENKVSETGTRIKGSYRLDDRWTGHVGYQLIETKVTNLDDVDLPLFRSLISEVVRSHSGFAQGDFLSRDGYTSIQVGFRYNYLDKFKKSLYEPRFTLNQRFANYFNVELLGEIKHQVASQIINFQNDFLGVEKRRWQLANDQDIPVMESKQVELGLHYSQKGWLLSAEGYYKMVEGITTQSQGFQDQYEFVKSAGDYEVYGLDFLFRKRFKGANLWMSYSYMDNTYTFENLQVDSFPSNLDITHAVNGGLGYTYKNFEVSTGIHWRTGKPTTEPVAGDEVLNDAINYAPSNTERLEDYMRWDASAMYRFKLKKTQWELGVSVWNLLDKNNEINRYYRVDALNDAQQFRQTSLGITTNASIRCYF